MVRFSGPVTSIEASFIGAFLSTLFYGFYLSVALRCSLILWQRRKRPAYLLTTHVLLFILVNIRCITVLSRALVALHESIPGGPLAESPIWSGPSLLVNSTLFLAIFVSDTFICYRTYIVWSKSLRMVLLPGLLLLGDMAVMLYGLIVMSNQNTPDYFNTVNMASEYVMIVTLVLNVTSTSLIAFRIWNVRRHSAALRYANGKGNDRLGNFFSILVESAAAYSIFLVAHIVLLSMDSYLIFVFIDSQTPIIGIVFSSIIISVSNGSAFGDSTKNESTKTDTHAGSGSSAVTPVTIGANASSRGGGRRGYPSSVWHPAHANPCADGIGIGIGTECSAFDAAGTGIGTGFSDTGTGTGFTSSGAGDVKMTRIPIRDHHVTSKDSAEDLDLESREDILMKSRNVEE